MIMLCKVFGDVMEFSILSYKKLFLLIVVTALIDEIPFEIPTSQNMFWKMLTITLCRAVLRSEKHALQRESFINEDF